MGGGFIASFLDDRDRPRPARRGALDFHRKTCDHEAGGGQRFEVVKLLDVAVTDVAAGLVALPDNRGVVGLRVALGGMDEGRVPAPSVVPVTRTPRRSR